MEIESKNGSKIRLHADIIDLGRGGLGFDSTEDRTVSRRHISFKLNGDGTRVYFQVIGKNPILVRDSANDDIRVFKSSERGELKTGDSFCVASKTPVWFDLKRSIACEDDESDSKIGGYDEAFAAEISGIDHDEIETGYISDIDPVKEFSFVVMGHEFDCYPKKLIHDIRNWNWFLEEPSDDRDEDDDDDENSEKKSRKSASKKRKKGGRKDDDDDDDDIWKGESEEDVELIKKSRNDLKPKYSTRSKDKNKKGTGASKRAKDNAASNGDDDDEEEEEEEDEETLGGFIVDDEDIGEGNEEDDEEEEFEENEDDE
ncbi:hypothetical protein SSX86_015519 [Deinandra increscens subsp. villosa]|uniref:FHA domain-containing protein n=1 Tax=Deinandra increscens subsp. villosa TaxID=3103831 RepID=A0AAP0GZC2_9ASTR